VQRITRRTGRTPRTVTADRGYGEHQVDQALHDVGVRQSMSAVGVPPTTRSPSRSTRRTVKSRTGIEGRISTLKRGYGWDRTRINGTQGARIWTGHGVLTHNLLKISALAA
jgi:transposase, IS5 family